MKKILIVNMIIMLFIACKNDDDNNTTTDDTKDSNTIAVEVLDKIFLLDEKWFLESIIPNENIDFDGDGSSNADLIFDIDKCEKLNFYVFDKNNVDRVVLTNDGQCANFEDNYGSSTYDYSVNDARKILNFDVNQFYFIGKLSKEIDFLENVEFLISKDSRFKFIKGDTFIINNEGRQVKTTYTLKADSLDRP